MFNLSFFFLDNSKPDESDKKKKSGISGGILAVAVVGVLILIFLISFLIHFTVKKLKNNSKARRRASGKYVNRSNISSNGRAVTIGDNNKGFKEGDVSKIESALYY